MKAFKKILILMFSLSTLVYIFMLSTAFLNVSSSLGDVDGDGKISASDARLALRISAKLLNNLSEESRKNADFNKDGQVTALDARLILRVSARLDKHPDDVLINKNKGEKPKDGKEVRGLWLASVYNLDFPSAPNLSPELLMREIDEIIKNAKTQGINTIFFQVRPSCDALYKSNIFPVSKFLNTNDFTSLSFDPLEYMLKISHESNIELHAWINPLRVTTDSLNQNKDIIDLLPKNSPASKNPEWTINYADGKVYFNPALPEVRQMIVDGVLEIIKNYDVDGIHFDDYFYPQPIKGEIFDDTDTYIKYGNGKSLDDFRRDNINILIRQVYSAIKAENPQLLFGVSPFAVWQNKSSDIKGSSTNSSAETYKHHYADTRKWVKDEILDYICPQIYWSMNQNGLEFYKVFDWWEDCVAGTNVRLFIGHTLSNIGNKSHGWDNPLEIINQIEYCKKSQNYSGSVFYRYSYMLENPLGISEKLKNLYSK